MNSILKTALRLLHCVVLTGNPVWKYLCSSIGFVQVMQLVSEIRLCVLQQSILVQRYNYVLAAALTC